MRAFCAKRKIVYQGFSLLTANVEALRHPAARGHRRAPRATPAQVVFRFAHAVGMLPLTGTTDAAHMREDLASRALSLDADEVQAIETIAPLEDPEGVDARRVTVVLCWPDSTVSRRW